MTTTDLTIRGDRVVTPGGLRPAAVHVRDGVITAVTDRGGPAAGDVVDAGDHVVAPGLVDIHVHVNEPGRTEWEGFATATRAAAAGGVTTIIDMPLNSVPPTVTVDALTTKRQAADGQCHVDVGFWGGIVPGNAAHLAALHDAGVFGFKAFLVDSGVDEFDHVDGGHLEGAMERLATSDALTLVHAEAADVIAQSAAVLDEGDPRAYATYLASRPDDAEVRAVQQVAAIALRTGGRAHVLHLSSAEALTPLRHAARAGAALTAETCPHYLALAADDIADGATAFKCAPPIRAADNRDLLWTALGDGTIALIATDHSPCTPELKRRGDGSFAAAWGGIASLQLGLSVVWTHAQARGHVPTDLVHWMSAAPAQLVGLRRKGMLAPGADADIVIWDPDATWTVDAPALEHRHPVTPYDGMTLRGRVSTTYLRGQMIYDGHAVTGGPIGRLLDREV
ncbi:MAG: allantoinase AllB [Actinobacteria bacterium]|nr:allantoinase AllB [Actinomycetota bacterium]